MLGLGIEDEVLAPLLLHCTDHPYCALIRGLLRSAADPATFPVGYAPLLHQVGGAARRLRGGRKGGSLGGVLKGLTHEWRNWQTQRT
jgi:hypothetical protein